MGSEERGRGVKVMASREVPRGGKWLYPLLFALQTAGAALLVGEVLPVYRTALANSTAFASETTVSLLGGSLIQIGYWLCYRMRPPRPRFISVALGHIVLFAARLIFLLPAAIFSFLFIARSLEMPVPRYVVISFGLFSLFCYVRELERLGGSLLEERKDDQGKLT